MAAFSGDPSSNGTGDSPVNGGPGRSAQPTLPSMDDPFLSPHLGAPASHREPHRYSAFDSQLFTLNASSPAQAKRALEAHMAETDRRLEEASRLGTALIHQQQEISDKLKEVERQQDEGEIGEELRRKLVDLEREYNEIGRETARAFLGPKRLASVTDESSSFGTPSVDHKSPVGQVLFSGQATNSPSKMTAPSRKQRNQPSSRVHDIEFATEISTSLLAQVRQLQTLLAEREESLKTTNLEKSRLELETEGYAHRVRLLDESEQRYKDENWSLETQTHDLMAALKEAAEREGKLNNNLSSVATEKNTVDRELEDMKQANAKLVDDQVAAQKANDAEIHLLRRNLNTGDAEKLSLQRKLEEVTSQNQELAKVVAATIRQQQRDAAASRDFPRGDDANVRDQSTPDNSPPSSPTRPTPRHNHLESETLRSSLGHAHRMIQSLKSTIHREKTEKIELKRILQESRDELEQRRRDSVGAGSSNKRQKAKSDALNKKPPRPDLLGAGRKERAEVEFQDADWEDSSPTRSVTPRSSKPQRKRAPSPDDRSDAYQTATEDADAFDTANEKETATESEAFQTGIESMADDSSDGSDTEEGLTETEESAFRQRTTPTRSRVPSSLLFAKTRDRSSTQSTATSADEDVDDGDEFMSPTQQPRYRLGMMKKGGRTMRRVRPSGEAPMAFRSRPSSARQSPATSFEEQHQQEEESSATGGQSLFAELAELGSPEGEEGEFGPPIQDDATITTTATTTSRSSTPRMPSDSRRQSEIMIDSLPRNKPVMVDSGTMTDPFSVPPSGSHHTVPETAGYFVGLRSGYWLHNPLLGNSTPPPQSTSTKSDTESDAILGATTGSGPVDREVSASHIRIPERSMSTTYSQHTEPVVARLRGSERVAPELAVSPIISSISTAPEPAVPLEMAVSLVESQHTDPEDATPIELELSSTNSVYTDPESAVPVELAVSSVDSEQTAPTPALPVELEFSSMCSEGTEPVRAMPLDLAVSPVNSEHTEPQSATPVDLELSPISSIHTAPATPVVLAEHEPVIPIELAVSSITSEHTEPVVPMIPESSGRAIATAAVEHPVPSTKAPSDRAIPAELTFSSISSECTEPVVPRVPESEQQHVVPAELGVSLISSEQTKPLVPKVPGPKHAELTLSSVCAEQQTEPIKAKVPEYKPSELSVSSVSSAHTEPVTPRIPEPKRAELEFSSVYSQATHPVMGRRPQLDLAMSSVVSELTEPVSAKLPEPEPAVAHVATSAPEIPGLTISSINTASTEPIPPQARETPVRLASRLSSSTVCSVETSPVEPVHRTIPAAVMLSSTHDDPITTAEKPRTAVRKESTTRKNVPVLEVPQDDNGESSHDPTNRGDEEEAGLPLGPVSGNAVAPRHPRQNSGSSMRDQKSDQGAQTILSSEQIDQILMDHVSAVQPSLTPEVDRKKGATGGASLATPKARHHLEPTSSTLSNKLDTKRPGSSGSQMSHATGRQTMSDEHERRAVEQQQQQQHPVATGLMGPPLAPASALRVNTQQRPRSPNDHASQAGSIRQPSSRIRTRHSSQLSRRSSVSSFASEIDERFNIQNNPMSSNAYGYGVGTDPRMIQAITQTMIGEFLWKYTRKAVSGDMSSTRHRRYFWVHPYTRTLYWSVHDPQTAGKTELKAKSVHIEAIRVVADENPYPPGLHCKSLEVVSPGRRVRFTATTSQRHETWFNALSYLLLRSSESETAEDNESNFPLEDIDEFNAGFLTNNQGQGPPAGRQSLSSYNSRSIRSVPKHRASSIMSARAAAAAAAATTTPAATTPVAGGNGGGRDSPTLSVPTSHDRARHGSASRLSTFFNSSLRESVSNRKMRHGAGYNHNEGGGNSIYDESLRDPGSVEDLRHVIDRQDEDLDRLENVRACCDGKHDVGSLSRSSRYSPKMNRHQHHHHH